MERRKQERRQAQIDAGTEERRTQDRRKDNERRSQSRISIEMWMEEITGDELYFRQAGNVSKGGVFFDKALPHPVGTEVMIKFSIPQEDDLVEINAKGKVVNVAADGVGMGIHFISFDGEGEGILHQYIEEQLEDSDAAYQMM